LYFFYKVLAFFEKVYYNNYRVSLHCCFLRRMMTMSRENAKSGNRCVNCGGRMRLVNVTWINRFQTPEASLYDSSVSSRKAKLGIVPRLSAQEMMCTCCGQRTPILGGKSKKVKKEKVKPEGKNNKKKRKTKKKGIVGFIKFLIFLAAIAAIVYFAYQYKDILIGYWEPLEGVFATVEKLIAAVKGFLKL